MLRTISADAAGVRHGPRGFAVDRRLCTSNRRVIAAGDVAGGYQFSHLAGCHAGIVLRNALFRLPAKVDTRALPWVTYTDPELAHVGLTEAQAREAHGQTVHVLLGSIVPYPTLSEISERAAGSYYTATLFGRCTRFLVRLLGQLG